MSETESLFAALLKLTGLRQIEVARELGVRRSTLAGWLAGYSPMPDEVVVKIHRLISIRLRRLDAKNPTSPQTALADTHGDDQQAVTEGSQGNME